MTFKCSDCISESRKINGDVLDYLLYAPPDLEKLTAFYGSELLVTIIREALRSMAANFLKKEEAALLTQDATQILRDWKPEAKQTSTTKTVQELSDEITAELPDQVKESLYDYIKHRFAAADTTPDGVPE